MFPAQNTLIVALMALGLVFAATPAVADEGTSGPNPVGCLNVMLSRIGGGLAVYAALNNVIGFGIATGQPGEGAEIAVMIVPSACGVIGLPATGTTQTLDLPEAPHVLLPLP